MEFIIYIAHDFEKWLSKILFRIYSEHKIDALHYAWSYISENMQDNNNQFQLLKSVAITIVAMTIIKEKLNQQFNLG